MNPCRTTVLLILAFGFVVCAPCVGRAQDEATTQTERSTDAPSAPPEVIEPETIPGPEVIVPTPSPRSDEDDLLNRPPLGLGDVLRHLDVALAMLDDNATTMSLAGNNGRFEKHLAYASGYLDHLVHTRSSALHYRWRYMGREYVYGKPARMQVFDESTVYRNVTSLRFYGNPRQGKVFVGLIKVYGEGDREIRQYRLNRWVIHDLPRYEVLQLGRPMEITRVEVMCYHDGDGKRRLYVEAGSPSQPDYSREVLYYLDRAQTHLRNARLDDLRGELQRAMQVMQDFYIAETGNSLDLLKPAQETTLESASE
ncbi:MAG: hypothetical protein ACOC29_03255 [Candidatus Sumerlaeota bacterium]